MSVRNTFGPDSADYREQLQCEIVLLAEERRSYASQLNDSLPIFQLAPDTLCTIFMFYKQYALADHLSPLSPYLSSQRRSGFKLNGPPWCFVPWVAVSYVCRRFRAVTLNFALLWSTLCTASVPWTAELIRRSKQAPLHVIHPSPLHANGTSDEFRDIPLVCFRLALSYSSRIEMLELLNFHLESLASYEEMFANVFDPQRFPNLRHFKFTLPGSPSDYTNFLTTPSPIPKSSDLLKHFVRSLIQDGRASLQSLHLSGFGRETWFPGFHSSSHISLSCLVIEACPDVTLNAILSTLEQLPQLQHLVIRDCRELDSYKLDMLSYNNSLMSIPLPFLRSFSLSGVLGVGGQLFRSLVLPLNVKLSLEAGSPPRPHRNEIAGFREADIPGRIEGFLRILGPYLQGNFAQDCSLTSIPDPQTRTSQSTSMLFAFCPGALCFSLSNGPDNDTLLSSTCLLPRLLHHVFRPSSQSPVLDVLFKFTAHLAQQPQAEACISDALLDSVKYSGLLEGVQHATLRDLTQRHDDICSWPMARWMQTVAYLPKLNNLDADLNYPSMALLTSLLDVRDRKEEFHTSAQRAFLDSIPPSAVRLQTLHLRRASCRITNKSPPIGGEGITHSAPGLFGSPIAAPVGYLPILPQPQYRSLLLQQLHFTMAPSPTFRPSHATISDRFLYVGPSSPPPPQLQTSNPPLGPSESAPSSNGFETVILFGREMPSMEALYDDLIRQRSLIEVLQGRRDAGLPLQTLVFRQSQMSEESFKELEEVVSEVDWDDRNVQSWKGQLWKKAVEGNASDNSNVLDVLV